MLNIKSKRYNILSTKTSFFISSTEEIESVQELKKKSFSSSYFIAGDSHIKTICLHIVIFTKHRILRF